MLYTVYEKDKDLERQILPCIQCGIYDPIEKNTKYEEIQIQLSLGRLIKKFPIMMMMTTELVVLTM